MTNFTKPHLACDADISKVKYPLLVQSKLDGVRALNVAGKLYARTLKRFRNKELNELLDRPEYAGLDGELTIGELTCPSLCRDTSSVVNSFDKPARSVIWNVFDYLHEDVVHLPYKERIDIAAIKFANDAWVHVIPYEMVDTETRLLELVDIHIANGHEGSIGRDPEGMHKNGRATTSEGAYIRFKGFVDEEAECYGLVEAMQNNNVAETNELGRTSRSTHKENLTAKGMVGSLLCRSAKWGEFIVGSGDMSHAERKHYWENQSEIVGKMITFKMFPHGCKDKPRFPTFKFIRDPVDIV